MNYRVYDHGLHRYLEPDEVRVTPNGYIQIWEMAIGMWQDYFPATTEWLSVERGSGLFDKNKHELFEGDTVKLDKAYEHDFDTNTVKIEYRKGCFWVTDGDIVSEPLFMCRHRCTYVPREDE